MGNDINHLFGKVKIEEPQITVSQISDTEGMIIIKPLLRGYGTTIGNSLRRVMLSSLPGSAVSSISISANNSVALHEMSTLTGVKEDVCEIVLNVKKIIAKYNSDKPKTYFIDIDSPCEIKAGDIKTDSSLTIINPEQHIATLANGNSFHMELTFVNGVGYVPSDKNKAKDETNPLGVIYVDSIFTPVVNVNYNVENTRVGGAMDYDLLTLNLTTNGSLTPNEAIIISSQILKEHFSLISSIGGICEESSIISKGEGALRAETLNMPIEDLNLSPRSFNSLKRAQIHTVHDIVALTADELCKIRNLGKKSFNEISLKMSSIGLNFREMS